MTRGIRVLVADENPEIVRQLRLCVEAAVPDERFEARHWTA